MQEKGSPSLFSILKPVASYWYTIVFCARFCKIYRGWGGRTGGRQLKMRTVPKVIFIRNQQYLYATKNCCTQSTVMQEIKDSIDVIEFFYFCFYFFRQFCCLTIHSDKNWYYSNMSYLIDIHPLCILISPRFNKPLAIFARPSSKGHTHRLDFLFFIFFAKILSISLPSALPPPAVFHFFTENCFLQVFLLFSDHLSIYLSFINLSINDLLSYCLMSG